MNTMLDLFVNFFYLVYIWKQLTPLFYNTYAKTTYTHTHTHANMNTHITLPTSLSLSLSLSLSHTHTHTHTLSDSATCSRSLQPNTATVSEHGPIEMNPMFVTI